MESDNVDNFLLNADKKRLLWLACIMKTHMKVHSSL